MAKTKYNAIPVVVVIDGEEHEGKLRIESGTSRNLRLRIDPKNSKSDLSTISVNFKSSKDTGDFLGRAVRHLIVGRY